MASSPIKAGGLLESCGKSILHGIRVLGSRFFIFSFFTMYGFSPDCLMIVKKAFSLTGQRVVILFMSSFSMSVVSASELLFGVIFHVKGAEFSI